MHFPTILKQPMARAAILALAACHASQALAHTSYILPNFFVASTESYVTLQSAFAEELFHPEVAVDANDFHVILPDGSRGEFEAIGKHRQLVILESPLLQDGTYRFTTGVRRGRMSKSALIDGQWKPVQGDKAPAGATRFKTSQTETVADVYVTKKGPTRAPVDRQIGRLVIQPVTHPSEVALDSNLKLKVLFDGKPLDGQTVVLDRGGAEYGEAKVHREVKTSADGSLDLKFDKPGVYLLMTRHKADAPTGSETDERSYTTSLTFEVQP
ncbi:hypothetical protein WSK_0093 [Novosphingobium sp. Rr 2-17]|uniref:DUF4198 domain-containing protein n=1 Tax=Novosphingobium sp. Rr 2-17 TaxID=555793 RepID=UPI000269AADC|nr:DUF4198 domain-containing protein [Novosphingobium sp. Rr 2-17]EIZ81148.1 hypothetical protein WSK_0093 [Novosphingobium sp. Rr 2-17]